MPLISRTRLVIIAAILQLISSFFWLLVNFDLIEYLPIVSKISALLGLFFTISIIIFFKGIYDKQKEE